jgi:hypothetical protein
MRNAIYVEAMVPASHRSRLAHTRYAMIPPKSV